jgi:hypothetical protein
MNAARNYLQLHLLVALCLLVVGISRQRRVYRGCLTTPARASGQTALPSSFYRCLPLILKLAHSLECVKRRSLGGVRGPGAASVHSVDLALVLWHIVVGTRADHAIGGLPDENGALGARRHDELLVGRDGNLGDLA